MDTVATDDKKPKLTICAVCHKSFTIPKLLPCGHFMCRDCLVKLVQSQPQAACPLCRCVIVDPTKQGVSVDEVVNGLPTDVAMTAIVEAETVLSKQHMCRVCGDVTAVALCLLCVDMLCLNCQNAHKKLSATKRHEVERLSSLTSKRLAAYHPATCPEHPKDLSQMYCLTHGTSVCLLCAATTHRKCPELVGLQSRVDELTAELVSLIDKLAEGEAKADDCLRLLDQQVAELQTEADMEEMKTVCDRLTEAVDTRFSQIQDMILKQESELNLKSYDSKQALIKKRRKAATHSNVIVFYKKFSNHAHFKDMVDVITGRQSDLETGDDLPMHKLHQELSLTIDNQAVTEAERIFSRLGEMSPRKGNRETHTVSQAAAGDKHTADGHQKERPAPAMSKKGWVTQFNPMTATPSAGNIVETRTQRDLWPPDITSIAVSRSCGELVYMSDWQNKFVKVFSLSSNSPISTVALDVMPWGMALVRNDLLAVTSFDANVVVLVDVANSSEPRVKKAVATKRQYRGISSVCATGNDDDDVALLVSCLADLKGPASVDTISLEGRWIRTIATSQSLPELQMPRYLHADEARGLLYVSDYGAHCVFCLELSTWRVLPQLRHPGLSRPCQVCTDSEGNLYVACEEGACVLVRSAQGAWRVLLSDTEHGAGNRPQCVCVTDTCLVVSYYNPTAVKIYQLSQFGVTKLVSSQGTK